MSPFFQLTSLIVRFFRFESHLLMKTRQPQVFPQSSCEFRESDQPSKKPFSMEEDQFLIQFVAIHGARNWSSLARQMGTRTPKQCRERWHNHLDPNINKGPWTFEEDRIVAMKQKELGNRWADIARFLPGRTDTLVKNRWNTSIKSRLQDIERQSRLRYGISLMPEPRVPEVNIDFLLQSRGALDFTHIPPFITH